MAGAIEAWSVARLSFEPRGWQVDFRGRLREALNVLEPGRCEVLHGHYGSADDQLVDAENVLFYNVGSRWFRHLTGTGIAFTRGVTVPPAPDGRDYGHYVQYELRPPRTPAAIDSRGGDPEDLARFAGVRLDGLDKPGPVWAAIRRQARPPRPGASFGGPFAVHLVVTAPRGWSRSPGNLIKPLLDGVVSAFHAHADPGDLSRVADRLSASGLGAASGLAAMLTDTEWDRLGSVRLVKPFGEFGVQWNPADHRCVAAELVIERTAPDGDGFPRLAGAVSRMPATADDGLRC